MRASTSACRCFQRLSDRPSARTSTSHLPPPAPPLSRALRSLADLDSLSTPPQKPTPSSPPTSSPRHRPQTLPPRPRPAAPTLLSASAGLDDPARPLLVLGLESSADDSCAAVLYSAGPGRPLEVRSNVVLKQAAIHERFGGIHPLHAQEAHQRNMPLAIQQALDDAGVTLAELDGVGFTRGPGASHISC